MFLTITGHMAQLGKKNLNLFQALRKEKAVKAKIARNTEVPNLQDPLVEVHVHGGTKRKSDVPTKQSCGKDVKRVRATLLGPRSSFRAKKPKACLIELQKTTVQRDIEINLAASLVNSIDNMEPNAMVKAMLEFNSKALILGRRLGSLLQREMKDGGQSKVEELQEELKIQADKHAKEKVAWEKEKEEWLVERKRLHSWKLRCPGFKKKLNEKIADMETDYDELKEKHDGLESKLEDLKGHIIQEHIYGFQKGLRQATFFYKDVDAPNAIFDVNKDVVDGQLVSEMESSLEEEVDKVAAIVDVNPDETVAVEVDVEPIT